MALNTPYAAGSPLPPGDPRVASGGNDQLVLLWDLADSVASLTAAAPEGAGRKGQHKEAPRLMGRWSIRRNVGPEAAVR